MGQKLLSPNAVVACTSPSFLPFTCAAIHSAIVASDTTNIDFYVVVVDGRETDLNAARDFFRKWTCVTVLSYSQPVNADQTLGRFSSAALTRLSLDQILSPAYSRVLYIDGDVHVQRGVEELFQLDLKGHSIGACMGISIRGFNPSEKRNAAFGLPTGTHHLNAGVILFDWQKTIQEGLLAKIRTALQTKSSLPIYDQDALNIALKGNFYHLDYRWNVAPFLLGYINDAYIVHFVGKTKPWNRKCPYHLQAYRKILANTFSATPWKHVVERREPTDYLAFPFKTAKHFFKNRKGAAVARDIYNIAR